MLQLKKFNTFKYSLVSGATENLGWECLPFLELRQALVCNLHLFWVGNFLKNPEPENNFVFLQLHKTVFFCLSDFAISVLKLSNFAGLKLGTNFGLKRD